MANLWLSALFFVGITITSRAGPVHAFAENSAGSQDEKCPYTSTIEQILRPLREGEEFENTVSYLVKGKAEFVEASAYKGNRTENYLASIRDIHYAMRENYAEMIQEIGKNIYPLIVASDTEPVGSVSGVGGTFTLYLEDGSSKTIKPTSPEFEMLKNLAHIPLGLFTIISPHFTSPGSKDWQIPMQNFQRKIQEAVHASYNIDRKTMPALLLAHSQTMLNMSNEYINQVLNVGIATIRDFERYTSRMYPYVEANIKRAAELQVQAVLPKLQEWKKELGNKWKNVYALIPTIWPVSKINPRLQILAALMSPEQVRGQVFMLENGGTVQQLRATMGRIVGDRAAALSILGTKTKEAKRLTFALSTRQDLLANYCQEAIDDYLNKTPNS